MFSNYDEYRVNGQEHYGNDVIQVSQEIYLDLYQVGYKRLTEGRKIRNEDYAFRALPIQFYLTFSLELLACFRLFCGHHH